MIFHNPPNLSLTEKFVSYALFCLLSHKHSREIHCVHLDLARYMSCIRYCLFCNVPQYNNFYHQHLGLELSAVKHFIILRKRKDGYLMILIKKILKKSHITGKPQTHIYCCKLPKGGRKPSHNMKGNWTPYIKTTKLMRQRLVWMLSYPLLCFLVLNTGTYLDLILL